MSMRVGPIRLALQVAGAVAAIAAVTAAERVFITVNATTVALSFVLTVLVVATQWGLVEAIAASVVGMFCFNYFFLPPVGTLTIADPQNWVALAAFVAVSLIASNLSAAARDRAALADERAQLLEERKNAELARRSDETKSALLASLAHDLRTPLT